MDAALFSVLPIPAYAAASAETIRFNLPRTLPQGWTVAITHAGGNRNGKYGMRTTIYIMRRMLENNNVVYNVENGTYGRDLP
jgi:hypothetical protein